MKTIRRSSRLSLAALFLSPVALLLAPVALLLSSLAASGVWSPSVMASEVQDLNAAVVGAPSDASTEDFIQEITGDITEEFSDDMLDFILSSDAEILQAIEHRPLLDMLDDGTVPGAGHSLPGVNSGGAVGMGEKAAITAGRAKQVNAADRHYE